MPWWVEPSIALPILCFDAVTPGPPVGIVLAGGRGRRLGGSKAKAIVADRPLLHWPLAALRAVLADVAVVAKRGGELPTLPADVALWVEPPAPQHPLAGIVHALRVADGRAVLVCAVDLPLVDADTVRRLVASRDGSSAVVAAADGRLQPLLGVYEPAALAALSRAPADAPLTDVVSALAPRIVAVSREVLINVNRPNDIAVAEAYLASRGYGLERGPYGADQPKVNE